MNLRTLQLLLLFAVIAVFALVNWSAFTMPTTLSLVFATVQAPLGLIMLALTALLAGMFLIYIVYQQAGLIADARRASRELAAQRQRAENAEASRVTELQALLTSELRTIGTRLADVQAEMSRHVDTSAQALAAQVTQTSNGLAAHLGEIEDKIDRALRNHH
jgi:uncharacterized integral membrane protein